LNICVFASGSGTNFKAIIEAKKSGIIKSDFSLLITNNSDLSIKQTTTGMVPILPTIGVSAKF